MTTALDSGVIVRLSDERKSFLHSMFTTACEGGIQYWAVLSKYRWSLDPKADDLEADINGFHAELLSTEGDWGVSHLATGYGLGENEPIHLDLEVMERGTRLFLRYCHGMVDSDGKEVAPDDQRALAPDHYWRQWLVAEATNGVDGDYDVTSADAIVQFGLFGQMVYA